MPHWGPLFLSLQLLLLLITGAHSLRHHHRRRRILHQPFFPSSSPPPPPPPPPNFPFFPSILSPPPPPPPPPRPPSPSALASFPVNISSLIRPHSHSHSGSAALAVSLSLTVVAVASLAAFLFFRNRKRKLDDGEDDDGSKVSGSGNSNRIPPPAPPRPRRKQRGVSANNSAEFLYLGTMVSNAGGGGDRSAAAATVVVERTESPELRPLPPLSRYVSGEINVGRGCGGGGGGVGADDGEEFFYSPPESADGGDRVITGSESRRVKGESVVDNCASSNESTTSSRSSSLTTEMSGSISVSPAEESASPMSSKPKTPEPIEVRSPVSDSSRSNQSAGVSSSSGEETLRTNRIPPPPPPLPPPPPPMMRRSSSPIIAPPVPVGAMPKARVDSKPLRIEDETKDSEETPRPKLKTLHWDKVRASSDREMVWDQLRSSSFKLNEEMIETLFVANGHGSSLKEASKKTVLPSLKQENRVLDPKKAQNIAILLRAVNVTREEVCDALTEGNAATLGAEVLESLAKMAPTKEEERKLKEYQDDSPVKLGHAERFLKSLIDVPFAFRRVEAMLYVANFDSEVEYLKKSFETLEAACDELRNSRMFLKLLEAVLKTGNRMNVGTNRGDAHAFKLDTLLKLVDVKGADGKTTLLHFVVQEIIKSEGARLNTNQTTSSSLLDEAKCRKLGLQVVSALSSELANVKKAASMDSDVLSNDVSKLSTGLANVGEVVKLNETTSSQHNSSRFSESMKRFMRMAEEGIIKVQAQESVALSLVKEITEYFHGNSAKEEAHPFRIFLVVRDFLVILDRVCKEVGMINERSAHKFPVPMNPMLPVPVNPTVASQGFGSFSGRRQSSSSDGDSSPA